MTEEYRKGIIKPIPIKDGKDYSISQEEKNKILDSLAEFTGNDDFRKRKKEVN